MSEYTLVNYFGATFEDVLRPCVGMLRSQIVNLLIQTYDFKSYLEVGVANTSPATVHTYAWINCPRKVSIDINPEAKPTFVGTSDHFFAQNSEYFDIIFIDGDHRCEQVERDIENSLKFLNPNGFIVCHDCLPIKEEDADRVTGRNQDSWKTIAKLRMTRSDLKIYVINTDEGCAVITRGDGNPLYVPEPGVDTYIWSYYWVHRKEMLNVIGM